MKTEEQSRHRQCLGGSSPTTTVFRWRAIFNLDKTILATEETNLACSLRFPLGFLLSWLFRGTRKKKRRKKSLFDFEKFFNTKEWKSRMKILIFVLTRSSLSAPFVREEIWAGKSLPLKELANETLMRSGRSWEYSGLRGGENDWIWVVERL